MKSQKQKKKAKKITNMLQDLHISNTEETSPAIIFESENASLSSKWPKLKDAVPDIFLHQPVNFAQHVRKLLSLGIKFYKPYLSRFSTKISCLTFEDHKATIQYFEKKQLPYHTFGHPSKRKMKAVIRGLPADIDLNKLKDGLKSASVPVIRVHKMYRRKNIKDDRCLILAVVPYTDEGKKIIQITKVFGFDVTVEPPVTKSRQCHRCQKWGHSQRYCHGQIKCVKCAGDHLSKKCERDPTDDPPTCANCGGEHTASFKQCPCCPDSLAHIRTQVQKQLKFKATQSRPEVVTFDNIATLYKNVFYKPESKVSTL